MTSRFFRRRSTVTDRTAQSPTIEAPIENSDIESQPVRSPAPITSWDCVIVDVETTGLFPGGHDRVVEIAAIRISPDGHVIDRLDTLVNPERDVGATHIHGITASDVKGAPLFGLIVGDIASLMAGAALVAHNATFDMRFLAAEFDRAGYTFPDTAAICTMRLPARVGVKLPAVNLQACCESFGIEYSEFDAHRAMYDAQRTAELYAHLVKLAPTQPPRLSDLGASVAVADRYSWPTVPPSGLQHPREVAQREQQESFGYLERLASTIGARRGIDPDHAPYVALLDRVLEDGIVDDIETEALIDLAHDLGLGTSDVETANSNYLRYLVEAAWDDGIVTARERLELERAAHLLGIESSGLGDFIDALQRDAGADPKSGSSLELQGQSVCFTGSMSMPRSDLARFAEDAGLAVRNSVTKTLDILVVADANSQSGKAVKARTYGTRVMSEEAFLRKIGATK